MIVYIIRNVLNNKLYVGSTRREGSERWMEHRKNLRGNRHHSFYLQRAWNKNGESAFQFEIIQKDVPSESIREHEQYWMDILKPEYNVSPSANGPGSLSAETKAKISAKLKGRKASPETRALLSKLRTGKKLSPESIEKTAAAHRGMKRSEETKIKMRNKQIEIASKLREKYNGSAWSPERKEKWIKSRAGKPGVPHTPETKQKIALVRKNWWDKYYTIASQNPGLSRKEITALLQSDKN